MELGARDIWHGAWEEAAAAFEPAKWRSMAERGLINQMTSWRWPTSTRFDSNECMNE